MQSTAIHTRLFAVVYGTAQQRDIFGSVIIRVHNINFAFVIGTLKHLVFPFSDMETRRASLRSVTRFYGNQFNAIQSSLVLSYRWARYNVLLNSQMTSAAKTNKVTKFIGFALVFKRVVRYYMMNIQKLSNFFGGYSARLTGMFISLPACLLCFFPERCSGLFFRNTPLPVRRKFTLSSCPAHQFLFMCFRKGFSFSFLCRNGSRFKKSGIAFNRVYKLCCILSSFDSIFPAHRLSISYSRIRHFLFFDNINLLFWYIIFENTGNSGGRTSEFTCNTSGITKNIVFPFFNYHIYRKRLFSNTVSWNIVPVKNVHNGLLRFNSTFNKNLLMRKTLFIHFYYFLLFIHNILKFITYKGFYISNIFFGDFNGLKQVKLPLLVNQIRFPFYVRKVVSVMANKRDFNSAANSPKRNNIIRLVGHYPTVVTNASKWSKFSFSFPIKFVRICNFCNTTYKNLRRKSERSLVAMIYFVMQFKVIENTFFPSHIRYGITNSISFLHRFEKQVSLFISRQKFYFQCQLHILYIRTKIQKSFLYRKIFLNLFNFKGVSVSLTSHPHSVMNGFHAPLE